MAKQRFYMAHTDGQAKQNSPKSCIGARAKKINKIAKGGAYGGNVINNNLTDIG